MNATLKKILVIIPVSVISVIYLRDMYYEHYSNTSLKRVLGFILSIFLLFIWILVLTFRKRQDNYLQVAIQSSFFVYVFAVLQLTGYFILFKELSSQDWWGKMSQRIETHDHVNLHLFDTMRRYRLFDRQIIGNAIMLLPLGIFIPLLNKRFRKLSNLFTVVFISFLVSLAIEILQLATHYRSADVDDVILNTAGACIGFLIYQVIKRLIRKTGP